MSFKTEKGTEIPLLNLKGKDYLEVKYRIVWFRERHPNGTIVTELVRETENECLAKATIYDEANRVLATAHKFEDRKGFQDFREKAETGATGRALALCGFGTQFAPELEEGERIVDSPVENRRELKAVPQKAQVQVPRVTKASSEMPGTICECGTQMMLNMFDKNGLYCNPKDGGCGAKRARG